MHAAGKTFVVIGILAGVVGIGALVGVIAGRAPKGSVTVPSGSDASKARNPRPLEGHTPFTYVAHSQSAASNVQPAVTSTIAGITNRPSAQAESTNAVPTWEDVVDEILQSDADDAVQAKRLLALYPHLPEEGQVEVAQHLANLTPDEDYAPVRQMLVDAKTSEEVSDVLLADLLNRPNALKLPTLLDIARNSQHAQASEAKDLLELYLDEDYGENWNAWQARMEEWLRENPD